MGVGKAANGFEVGENDEDDGEVVDNCEDGGSEEEEEDDVEG